MDGLEIVTGAGGALGVCAWVMWHQAQQIERMRRDLRELGDAHRDDQRAVYARLVEVVGTSALCMRGWSRSWASCKGR